MPSKAVVVLPNKETFNFDYISKMLFRFQATGVAGEGLFPVSDNDLEAMTSAGYNPNLGGSAQAARQLAEQRRALLPPGPRDPSRLARNGDYVEATCVAGHRQPQKLNSDKNVNHGWICFECPPKSAPMWCTTCGGSRAVCSKASTTPDAICYRYAPLDGAPGDLLQDHMSTWYQRCSCRKPGLPTDTADTSGLRLADNPASRCTHYTLGTDLIQRMKGTSLSATNSTTLFKAVKGPGNSHDRIWTAAKSINIDGLTIAITVYGKELRMNGIVPRV
tara:strand:+ start:1111 stop:1938 length:828 start_codon:yes stop_codon:yes gene_type:complete